MLVLHDDIENYTLEQHMALEDAYNELEAVAQGGKLTIDQTRIRVAYVRLKRGMNFRISQATTKKVAAPKQPKQPRIAKPKTVKAAIMSTKTKIAEASRLFSKQLAGEELTEEEKLFLDTQLKLPPPV